jgi:hypothetical protein
MSNSLFPWRPPQSLAFACVESRLDGPKQRRSDSICSFAANVCIGHSSAGLQGLCTVCESKMEESAAILWSDHGRQGLGPSATGIVRSPSHAGRLAYYEFGAEHVLFPSVGPALRAGKNRLEHSVTYLVPGDLDGRQGWRGKFRKLDVIEASDGYMPWNVDAVVSQLTESADGDHVVDANDRRWIESGLYNVADSRARSFEAFLKRNLEISGFHRIASSNLQESGPAHVCG